MTTLTNKRIKQASDHPIRNIASKTGRFLLHLLEMLIAMQVGMGLFHLMLGLIRIYSNSRAFESGTALHAIVMTVFMTIPMAAWMIFRGHGWRHCIEMVVAMVAPVALIGLLCQIGIDEYLPWLAGLSTPLMFLGMILAMLYRRDHYTRAKSHVVEHADVENEPACH
jgi:vacuolar-type H+-ATPase subunit I/STV1